MSASTLCEFEAVSVEAGGFKALVKDCKKILQECPVPVVWEDAEVSSDSSHLSDCSERYRLVACEVLQPMETVSPG